MNQKLIKGDYTSQKGITLIALVITIIVLLILAGVTINMVLGDDGIIKQAQQAKAANENAMLEEEIAYLSGEVALNKYGAASSEELLKDAQDVINWLEDKGIVAEGELIIKDVNTIGYRNGSKDFSIERCNKNRKMG